MNKLGWKEWVALAGGILEVGATVWYIWDIWHGDTRPHWISWLGFTAIGVVGTIAAFNAGAGPGAYVAAVFAVSTFSIFVLSLLPRFGGLRMDELGRLDVPVGLIGATSVILQLAKVGSPSVYATIAWLGDPCFAWYTLRKAWSLPRSESLAAWQASLAASVLGVVGIAHYSYASTSYPVYLVIGNGVIAGTIIWRRREQAKHTKGAGA